MGLCSRNRRRFGAASVAIGTLLALPVSAAWAAADECARYDQPATNVVQRTAQEFPLSSELLKTRLTPEKTVYPYAFRLTRRTGRLPVTFRSDIPLPSASPRNPIRVEAELTHEDAGSAHHALVPSANVSGGDLRVLLCIDPKKLVPGSYTGTVRVDDPRLSPASASFTVSLQYERWWLIALGYGLLLMIAGTGVVWLGTLRARSLPLNRIQVREDLGQFLRLNAYGVLLGLAAAFAVWRTQYLGDETWAGTLNEHLGLLAAIGPAYIGGLATGAVYSVRQHQPEPVPEPRTGGAPSPVGTADEDAQPAPPAPPAATPWREAAVRTRPRLRRRTILIGAVSAALTAIAVLSAGAVLRPVVRTQTPTAEPAAGGTAMETTVPNVYRLRAADGLAQLEQARLVPFAFIVCSSSVPKGLIRQVVSSDGTKVVDTAGVLVNRLPVGTTVEVKVSSGVGC
jgi:hypothetical protein